MRTIIRFELKKWVHSKAAWSMLVLWCLLVIFATQQRNCEIQKIRVATDSSTAYEVKKSQAYYTLLDSTEQQLKQFEKYQSDPRNPHYFNRQVPSFGIFKPGPLNLFATGQSDLLPQQYVISSRTDFRLQNEEAVNGVQLLYGKLDVAFILVFILPLVIIAFNYNVLSSEKENGTLSLVLTQNSGLLQLAFAKTFVSFLFSSLLLLIPLACMWVYGNSPFKIGDATGIYLLSGILYSLFWHLLCIAINSRLRSSAWNATTLVISWLVLVFIYPASVNIVAEIVHPVPSRTQFVTAYRNTLSQIEKQHDGEILDKYFFDHPELVKQDTAANERHRANEFWKAYHMNHARTQEQLKPLYDAHSYSLRSANKFAARAGLLSPAAGTQYSLLLLAGQSSEQYLHFSESIARWREPYLQFILDKLVQDKDISLAEARQLKKLNYPSYSYSKQIALHLLVLAIINIGLLIISLLYCRKASIV